MAVSSSLTTPANKEWYPILFPWIWVGVLSSLPTEYEDNEK
jgi:hypothetical protein